MLNISKYHSAIVCCSVVATASLAGFVQSAHAAEQIVCPNVRAERGSILIAQTNGDSNITGTNVSNSPSGSFSPGGGSSGGGFNPAFRSQAGTISTRLGLAQSNYNSAATALEGATAQSNVAASPIPVRYGRQSVGDIASCGCPNADTVGTTPTARPELVAARAAEADAATQLAAAKAEAQKFIESIKSDTARISNVDNTLW